MCLGFGWRKLKNSFSVRLTEIAAKFLADIGAADHSFSSDAGLFRERF
jgi:hypothetical protein